MELLAICLFLWRDSLDYGGNTLVDNVIQNEKAEFLQQLLQRGLWAQDDDTGPG